MELLLNIKILIIIFSLLFILENKPMNILFNFIGIIISVAFLIGYHNADYISYLLIIIYCSALTIIFGFVLMLVPSSPYLKLEKTKSKYIGILLTLILMYLYTNNKILVFTSENLGGNNNIYFLINKIGNMLYLDNNNIIKFLISTLILLLALIALFFIIKPTKEKNLEG